jgi:hypothetical protein
MGSTLEYPVDINKPIAYLEERTGLIYGKGDFYRQTVGMIYAWITFHPPQHEDTETFMSGAICILLCGIAEEAGGLLVYNADSGECFVYVAEESQHYIVRIEKGIHDMIIASNWDFSPYIEPVTTMGKKISTDHLNHQLKEALADEDFELAAQLRDKIKRRKHKGSGKNNK